MTDIVEKLRHIGRIESSDPGMYKATHLTAGDALRAADEIERLRKALQYYAGHHAIPSEGPWGIDSDDFGNVARAALEGK
jgi:acetoin utilization deacetylase AcuC-like enzyme